MTFHHTVTKGFVCDSQYLKLSLKLSLVTYGQPVEYLQNGSNISSPELTKEFCFEGKYLPERHCSCL